MRFGLEAAWARLISLVCAIQVTFVLNGFYVFRCLRFDRGLLRHWTAYVAANAFGNLCNYWFFVTLVSLHQAFLSRPAYALCLASLGAWTINYCGARLLVFGGALRRGIMHRAHGGERRAARGERLG